MGRGRAPGPETAGVLRPGRLTFCHTRRGPLCAALFREEVLGMGFLARYLVRARWAIIVVWVMIGFFAARAAPKTVELLNTRGGSRKPTEAGQADRILRDRFSSPLSEFFAVTVE